MKNLKIIHPILLACLLSLPGMTYSQQVLTLAQCRQLALEHNQKLRIASEHQSAAGELQKSAFTQFLPNFSINGAYTRTNKQYSLFSDDILLPVVPYTAISSSTGTFNPSVLQNPAIAPTVIVIDPATGKPVLDRNGNPIFRNYAWLPASEMKFGSKNLYLVNAGMTQPIYMGGKIREAYKITKYTSNIADGNKNMETSDLMYKTEEGYWQVVSLQEKAKLAGRYKKLLEKLISDLENLQQEGVITSNEVLKAKVKLNEAELKLLQATDGVALSKMSLCQTIGLPLNADIVMADTLTDNPGLPDMGNTLEQALAQRPELKILEQELNVAKSGVNLMKSRYLPNIGLTANYFYSNPNPYNGFREEFGNDWNMGIVCNIPVFHWGDKNHSLNAMKHERNAAELKLEETRELISLQVRQAIYKLQESQKKADMTRVSVSQADENLKITQDNFGEGIMKTTDVLEAQALWQSAYASRIEALTEYKLAVTNLEKVSGNIK